MKKYLFLFLALILFIITFLFGCEYFQLMSYKEWLEKNNKKVAVYAIGTINSTACYWKNDNKPVYLPDCTGDAQSIFVYGHDVYVGGQDTSGYACYWKNGEKVRFSSYSPSTSNGICVVDGVVFNAVNYSSGTAELWKDNEKINLNLTSSISSNASCIYVDPNDFGEFNIVVGGYIRTATYRYPCYWKDDGTTRVDLGYGLDTTGTNSLNSIFLYNSKVYSCGFFNPNDSCWVDNVIKYNLALILNSIYVDKGDIYLSGDGTNNYWKNDNTVSLAGAGAQGYSIKVFNEDVYVAGYDSGTLYACYWINGSGPYYFNDDGVGASNISTSGSSIFVTWDY